MVIAVQGNIIDTCNIYKISPVWNGVFSIKSLNGRELEVKIDWDATFGDKFWNKEREKYREFLLNELRDRIILLWKESPNPLPLLEIMEPDPKIINKLKIKS